MVVDLPGDWEGVLSPQLREPYFAQLAAFVDAERAQYEIFPSAHDVFNAFKLSGFDLNSPPFREGSGVGTRVLLLGQDPYHDTGQAHGLCFSVRPGVRLPPSLKNILKERESDIGLPMPMNGFLEPWARQGILMLNAVLTVRAHEANSHKAKGWEQFTDSVISALSARPTPLVFVLWGGYAQKKRDLIDASRHVILESTHPSPLSAHNGFLGSRPFTRINSALQELGQPPIDWRLNDAEARDAEARDVEAHTG